MSRFKACFNVAKVSFLIGTFLFLMQFIFRDLTFFTVIGYYYVMAALIVNSIIVFVLIIALLTEHSKKETLKSIGIIMANIPIAFLYFVLVIEYLI